MKKIFKKIMLVLLMVFQFSYLNVNAVSITTGSQAGTVDTNSRIVTNTANLTVTGVQTGDQFKAYKVLDAFYNTASNQIIYEFTADFKNFLNQDNTYNTMTVEKYFKLTSGNITNGSTKTTSTLDQLVSKYATYIRKTPAVNGTVMNVSGTTASLTTAAGAYLILPTATTKVYAVMVGNLDFEAASSNSWNLNDETIVAKVSNPNVTKTVDGGATGSKNINEEYTYKITSNIPAYPTNAVNKTYKIVDTLSSGVDLVSPYNIVVKDGSQTLNKVSINANQLNFNNTTGQTLVTVNIAGRVLTFNCDLTHFTGNLTVEYKAKLNNSAVLGGAGNANTAVLTYSVDPYNTQSNATVQTSTVSSKVYTYEIKINLTAAEDSGIKLENAKFEVYSDSGLNNKVGEVTTNNLGVATLRGVKSGTYYLKQISSSAGYNIKPGNLPVQVGNVVATGTTTVDLSNDKSGILPFTGGAGSMFYVFVGLMFILGGFFFLIKNRRRKEDEEATN